MIIIDLDEEASEIIIGGTISMTANTVSIECYSREEAEKLFDSLEQIISEKITIELHKKTKELLLDKPKKFDPLNRRK